MDALSGTPLNHDIQNKREVEVSITMTSTCPIYTGYTLAFSYTDKPSFPTSPPPFNFPEKIPIFSSLHHGKSQLPTLKILFHIVKDLIFQTNPIPPFH